MCQNSVHFFSFAFEWRRDTTIINQQKQQKHFK